LTIPPTSHSSIVPVTPFQAYAGGGKIGKIGYAGRASFADLAGRKKPDVWHFAA
jgi:hypothetical protein